MIYGSHAGVTLSDWDELTVGMILDAVFVASDEINKAKDGSDNNGVREATQADFDRF